MAALDTSFFLYFRETGNGRYVACLPRIYTTAIITGDLADAYGFDEHWCFEDKDRAIGAATAWDPSKDPEPEGWIRHPRSGRRRPAGDKSKEHVAL